MQQHLSDLIAMRTVSGDHTANNKALDYVEAFFVARGLHVKRFSFNDFGALVATTVKDSKTSKVMLTGHLDVVPAPTELFTLREEDGNWFGRGVYDMKFAIAAYMEVVDRLARAGTLHQYDLGVMLTTDEEIGGHNGMLRLVDMGYRPGVCILPDGAENWNIETLAKGLSYGHMYVDGKTAHGSRPWEGESAIFKLLDAIAELRQLFSDQKLHSNTLNIGLIDGGEAINQIPSKAHATLDIRYMRHEDYLRLHRQMLAIFERHDVTYKEDFYDHPCVTDLKNPLVASFMDSVEQVAGVQPTGTLSGGGSDARHLAKVGVPAILTHPPGGNWHSDSEWISIRGCEQFSEVLLDYLRKTAVFGVK